MLTTTISTRKRLVAKVLESEPFGFWINRLQSAISCSISSTRLKPLLRLYRWFILRLEMNDGVLCLGILSAGSIRYGVTR